MEKIRLFLTEALETAIYGLINLQGRLMRTGSPDTDPDGTDEDPEMDLEIAAMEMAAREMQDDPEMESFLEDDEDDDCDCPACEAARRSSQAGADNKDRILAMGVSVAEVIEERIALVAESGEANTRDTRNVCVLQFDARASTDLVHLLQLGQAGPDRFAQRVALTLVLNGSSHIALDADEGRAFATTLRRQSAILQGPGVPSSEITWH